MVEYVCTVHCSLPFQPSAAVLSSVVLELICALTAEVLIIARPSQARAKAVQRAKNTVVATGGR